MKLFVKDDEIAQGMRCFGENNRTVQLDSKVSDTKNKYCSGAASPLPVHKSRWCHLKWMLVWGRRSSPSTGRPGATLWQSCDAQQPPEKGCDEADSYVGCWQPQRRERRRRGLCGRGDAGESSGTSRSDESGVELSTEADPRYAARQRLVLDRRHQRG